MRSLVGKANLALGLATPLILTGCGVTASSHISSAPPAPSTVYTLQANRTSQTVMAGQPATFTITATTRNGRPVSGQPVTFYVGPMVPLSGVAPTHWYASGSKTAQAYISRYSAVTRRDGTAVLTLSPKPADSMEMVGVRVGNLSSFSGHRAIGSLDAWWTTPATMPSVPIGDWVTVTPFVTTLPPKGYASLSVQVHGPKGVIPGAMVQFIQNSSGMGGMTGSGSTMQVGPGMSSGSGTTVTASGSGAAAYTVMTGAAGSLLPVRIVVTQGSAISRIAGGMNAEFVTR